MEMESQNWEAVALNLSKWSHPSQHQLRRDAIRTGNMCRWIGKRCKWKFGPVHLITADSGLSFHVALCHPACMCCLSLSVLFPFPLSGCQRVKTPWQGQCQPPLRWQLPCESRSHLLGGSCKLNGLRRASESCEVQRKCKGFSKGGRWRVGPAHCPGHHTGSFVEHFTLISAWVQNATQAEWEQFAPPFLFFLYWIQCQDKMKWRS